MALRNNGDDDEGGAAMAPPPEGKADVDENAGVAAPSDRSPRYENWRKSASMPPSGMYEHEPGEVEQHEGRCPGYLELLSTHSAILCLGADWCEGVMLLGDRSLVCGGWLGLGAAKLPESKSMVSGAGRGTIGMSIGAGGGDFCTLGIWENWCRLETVWGN